MGRSRKPTIANPLPKANGIRGYNAEERKEPTGYTPEQLEIKKELHDLKVASGVKPAIPIARLITILTPVIRNV